MADLTHAEALLRFSYDPLTGSLTWKNPLSRRMKPGDRAGSKTGDGRLQVYCQGKTYQVHRLIWFMVTGTWPKAVVDHRDGNPSNNAWANLREATQSQNCQNRSLPRINSSGFKGVTASGSRWRAIIDKEHIGCFGTPQEAALAYDNEATTRYGSFAKTNKSLGLIPESLEYELD